MNPKRPPGKAPFLGTDDIVRRLREAQPEGLGSVGRKLRAVGFALAIVVGTGGLALGLRQTLAGRVFGRKTNAALAGSGADARAHVVSSMPAPAAAEAVQRSDSAVVPPPGRHREQAAASEDSRHHAGVTAVQVRVVEAVEPCTILVDGRKVAQAKQWTSKLSRGRHQVTVRHGKGEQNFVLQLQAAPQEIIFDLKARRAVSRPLATHAESGRE